MIKKIFYIALFALFALSAFAQTRDNDVIRLVGTEANCMIGETPADIVAFKYSNGWTQVPVQINEKIVKDIYAAYGPEDCLGGANLSIPWDVSYYCDPNSWIGRDSLDFNFDADDELLVMASDLGTEGTINYPQGVISSSVCKMRIDDPLDASVLGYIYLFLQDGSLDQTAGKNYVQYDFEFYPNGLTGAQGTTIRNDYKICYADASSAPPSNAETSTVTTDHYEIGFEARWIEKNWKVKAAGASAVDILDVHDGTLARTNKARNSESYSRATGTVAAAINGPIMAVRTVLGTNSGRPNTMTIEFLPNQVIYNSDYNVHAPAGNDNGEANFFFDFNSSMQGVFYSDSRGNTDILINGTDDSFNKQEIADWILMSGDNTQGSLVILNRWTGNNISVGENFPATNDVSFNGIFEDMGTGAGAYDGTGDGAEYGTVGWQMEHSRCWDRRYGSDGCQTDTPFADINIIRSVRFLPANRTEAEAARYNDFEDNPLTATEESTANDVGTNISTPTEGQEFVAGDDVTIQATAQHPNGIATMELFLNGASVRSINTSNANPANATWNAASDSELNDMTAGNYEAIVISTPAGGAPTSSDTINFFVEEEPSSIPVVNFTTPTDGQQFTEGDNVTVQVTATDPDGILEVQLYLDGVFQGVDEIFPYEFTINDIQQGTRTLRAVAIDFQADEGENSIDIQVNAEGNNPIDVSITNIIENDTFPVGTNLTVIGEARHPNGVRNLRLKVSSTVTIQTADQTPVTETWDENNHNDLANMQEGNYALILAMLPAGQSTTINDTVNIVIADEENNNGGGGNDNILSEIIEPDDGIYILPGSNLTVRGRGKHPNGIQNMRLKIDATDVLQTDNVTDTIVVWDENNHPDLSNMQAGNDTLILAVLPVGESETVNDTIVVFVTDNLPPTVAIDEPKDGSSFVENNDVLVEITATDPDLDGNITQVEFFYDGVSQGTDNTAPYEFTISSITTGTHTLRAEATDNETATISSETVTISVVPPFVQYRPSDADYGLLQLVPIIGGNSGKVLGVNETETGVEWQGIEELSGDTDDQNLTISNDTLYIEDANFVVLPPSSDSQYLNLSNDTLSIDRGNFVVLPPSSDSQTISLNNDTLSIENGNFVVLPPSVIDTASAVPVCKENNNPLLPDVLRISIDGVEYAVGNGNPVGSYQAPIGSQFTDKATGYTYKKYGSGIGDWTCILDGTTQFAGGGGNGEAVTLFTGNGLSMDEDTVILGGELDRYTSIDLSGHELFLQDEFSDFSFQNGLFRAGAENLFLSDWEHSFYTSRTGSGISALSDAGAVNSIEARTDRIYIQSKAAGTEYKGIDFFPDKILVNGYDRYANSEGKVGDIWMVDEIVTVTTSDDQPSMTLSPLYIVSPDQTKHYVKVNNDGILCTSLDANASGGCAAAGGGGSNTKSLALNHEGGQGTSTSGAIAPYGTTEIVEMSIRLIGTGSVDVTLVDENDVLIYDFGNLSNNGGQSLDLATPIAVTDLDLYFTRIQNVTGSVDEIILTINFQ